MSSLEFGSTPLETGTWLFDYCYPLYKTCTSGKLMRLVGGICLWMILAFCAYHTTFALFYIRTNDCDCGHAWYAMVVSGMRRCVGGTDSLANDEGSESISCFWCIGIRIMTEEAA